MEQIKIKYHNPNMPKLEKIGGHKSDWIDLRASQEYELKAGNFYLIDLGVSMCIPAGYEAHVAPRSSSFKNYGFIQTNSIGIIDQSYSGDDDIWKLPVYATRDVTIKQFDRICQFRIIKKQPPIMFKEVESLGNNSRGGFGSTGVE